jgi:hypothetical protein
VHYDAERIDETFRVGVEIEACLLDKTGIPVNAETLIKEHQGTSHPLDYDDIHISLYCHPHYIRSKEIAIL